MKIVYIYDSYGRVLDESGEVLHEASGSEGPVTSPLTYEDACTEVNRIYEETKLLGPYTDVVREPEKGLVEIKIDFPDKRKLHRVIYLKDGN